MMPEGNIPSGILEYIIELILCFFKFEVLEFYPSISLTVS